MRRAIVAILLIIEVLALCYGAFLLIQFIPIRITLCGIVAAVSAAIGAILMRGKVL